MLATDCCIYHCFPLALLPLLVQLFADRAEADPPPKITYLQNSFSVVAFVERLRHKYKVLIQGNPFLRICLSRGKFAGGMYPLPGT
jgi:hypothetical protein